VQFEGGFFVLNSEADQINNEFPPRRRDKT